MMLNPVVSEGHDMEGERIETVPCEAYPSVWSTGTHPISLSGPYEYRLVIGVLTPANRGINVSYGSLVCKFSYHVTIVTHSIHIIIYSS